jgi:hypothetical protein
MAYMIPYDLIDSFNWPGSILAQMVRTSLVLKMSCF